MVLGPVNLVTHRPEQTVPVIPDLLFVEMAEGQVLVHVCCSSVLVVRARREGLAQRRHRSPGRIYHDGMDGGMSDLSTTVQLCPKGLLSAVPQAIPTGRKIQEKDTGIANDVREDTEKDSSSDF